MTVRFSNIKIKALSVLFLVTVVVSFFSLNTQSLVPAVTTMQAASLPIVKMKTAEGTIFNELHGYTSEVDAYLINESVTPLQEDRRLNVVIDKYDENVTRVSYKIRKLDDLSLLEDTEVKDMKESDGSIEMTLRIKNLIENDTEYLMEIAVATDAHENISYYTKVICSQGLKLQEKLQFILDFNRWTMNKEELDNITPYIETNSTGDNSNYGRVNIHSTKKQIGWGDLEPYPEAAAVPVIKEINSEVASISLKYQCAVQGATRSYDNVKVDEFYRIRQSKGQIYLLNFERMADQVFDSRGDLMESSRINLGISSDESAYIVTSSNGHYTCFVRQGNLWCFNDSNNTFTRIFSFEDESSDNIREGYQEHNIKVMDVDDKGSMHFIVYGYMNRGEHEGQVGVSLCSYDARENKVNELIYIPVDVPYQVLSENIGEIAYIGGNGAFYILLDDSLYSIDLTSKEKMTEISGLNDETYAVSADGSEIAYSLSGELYNTDTIRIFNMRNNTDYVMRAEGTDLLRVLGYIKNDFVYGRVHRDDITKYNNGTVMFPMYRIEIQNKAREIIKEYAPDGIYVSNAEVTGMRLTMTRVEKTADGDYVAVSADQLLNKDENAQDSGAYVEVVTTEERKKELYIDLVNQVTDVGNVTLLAAKSVQFSEGEIIRTDAQFTDAGRYYVYGYGRFQGSYTSLERAIQAAYTTYGTVYDRGAKTIWKRYKENAAQIGGIDNFLRLEGASDSFGRCLDTMLAAAGIEEDVQAFMEEYNAVELLEHAGLTVLQLHGVTLENVLYYINMGIPVTGRIGADSYVILTGYDTKNVTYIDMTTGKRETALLSDLSKIFAQWNNVFLTCKR